MLTKSFWYRFFPSDWISETTGMKSYQISTYMMLMLLMYKKRQPIFDNACILARISGCSVKTFNEALDFLLSDEKIIRLEDGRLWSLEVEEELKNSDENLNKFSERASKAANARWQNHKKTESDNKNNAHDAKHKNAKHAKNAKHVMHTKNAQSDACDDKQNDAKKHSNDDANKHSERASRAAKERWKNHEKSDSCINLLTGNVSKNNAKNAKHDACDANNITIHNITYNKKITLSSYQKKIRKRMLNWTFLNFLENQIQELEPSSASNQSKLAKSKRGCRLPEDYEPDREAAVTLGLPPECVTLEIAKFKDYWLSKAGANATKVDWHRTWCNWVRTAIEQLERKRSYGNSNNSQSGGQRGWGHSVARYMSTIKNSSDLYSILRDEDDKTAVSLGSRQEALPFRSEGNYLFGT
ncbi:DUF1376 domain-containing protein [Bartonella ancashensis]|uniref:Uncharacterized protein n=3 Tax=Bartonella ancashensis TaxID=1318743 RepID=A0A0M4L7W4_9HYPH|nr:DUF1376 domain-containing protein [Bartonella ancashensis]ALE03426.1 hypothetical protein PU02_0612 [Bartonella ancashensis]